MLLWLMGRVMHFHPGATPPPGALELTGNKWPTGLVWTVMPFLSRRGAPAPLVGPNQGVARGLCRIFRVLRVKSGTNLTAFLTGK